MCGAVNRAPNNASEFSDIALTTGDCRLVRAVSFINITAYRRILPSKAITRFVHSAFSASRLAIVWFTSVAKRCSLRLRFFGSRFDMDRRIRSFAQKRERIRERDVGHG